MNDPEGGGERVETVAEPRGRAAAAATDPRGEAGGGSRRKRFRWGFFSAAGMILLCMVIGQGFFSLLERFGEGGFGVRDVLFLAFCASTLALLWLLRGAVWRFLTDMHTGVALLGIGTLAVITGVLVPQIEGFEDPDQRVTPANYQEQFDAFKWAEGYFLYHLTHLYGLGMPSAQIPPGVEQGLEEFGRLYGREEQKNRRIQMEAAFRSRPKSQEIGKFIRRHEDAFRAAFDVCTFLDLNRAYKSYWFRTLGYLLGFSLLLNLLRFPLKSLFTIRRLGFTVSHVGMLTLLVGLIFSNVYTDRGILNLDLRNPPQRDYWRYHDRNKISRMPFWVRLDRFARQDWKQIEVGFPNSGLTSRPPSYTLWPGRGIELDWREGPGGEPYPRVRLRVLALYEHAHVDPPRLEEAPEGDPRGLGPIAALAVPDFHRILQHQRAGIAPEDAGRLEQPAYLIPEREDRALYWDFRWKFRLRGIHLSAEERAALRDPQTLFPPPEEERLGTLVLRNVSGGEVEAHQVSLRAPGQVIEVGDGRVIEITRVTANYAKDPDTLREIPDDRPLAEQPPMSPGVWVEIRSSEGETEQRLVLENVDAEGQKAQEGYTFDDLVLKLEWDRWRSPGPPRYVLAWGGDVAPMLYGEDGTTQELSPGEMLDLPEVAGVRLERALENARTEKNIRFEPNRVVSGFDESFYSVDPKGLELEVILDGGLPTESRQVVRMASTKESLADFWQSPDGSFYVQFFENDRVMPFEWRSVLSIYEPAPDGRARVYSGATGLELDLPEEQRRDLVTWYEANQGRYQGEFALIRDQDGDGKSDFIGYGVRVDIGPEAEREIRVNDYFRYKGYRFFQTNAIPEIPTYSGIGVVFDPGIETVLAGMYIVIGGTVIAFILRPIFTARRRSPGRRSKMEATA